MTMETAYAWLAQQNHGLPETPNKPDAPSMLLGTQGAISARRQVPVGELSPHVRARGFSVFYDSNEAVKKATLDIPAGLITAIIGPSGCG